MQKSCPICGADTFAGARFCRRCGAPLREAGEGVSPQAATIPLGGEGRSTGGFTPEEPGHAADTTRVGLAELERLLREQAAASPPAAAPVRRADEVTSPPDARRETPDPEATLVPAGGANPRVTRPPLDERPPEGPDEELTISVPWPAPETREMETGPAASPPDTSSPPGELPPDWATRTSPPEWATTTSPPGSAVHTSPTTTPDWTVPTSPPEWTAPAPPPVQPPPIFQSPPASPSTSPPVSAPAPPTPEAGPVVTTEPVVPFEPAAPAEPVAPPPRRRWLLIVLLCLAALLLLIAAAWLVARFWRPAAPTDVSTLAPTAPAPTDPNQLLEEKVAEAEALLAQGNFAGALAALREANRLVPSNAKAHRRLGELLLETGARREAVEEFRAVTRHDPNDFTAWRQLAAAQFAEGLHRDAADSYRRLVELVGEAAADPNDLLSYADALRLSGRPEEARAVYERLSALPFADLADAARRRLAELTQPTPEPTPAAPADERADARTPAGDAAPGPQPAPPTPAPPTPAPTPQAAPPQRPAEVPPAERYRRGVEQWSSNRAAALDDLRAAAAAGNPEAHYYLGLGYVEGRSVQSLKRAEIVAALAHFQTAQRSQFAAQARRYAQQLEREFDRVRQ
jgi:tetratricopeptide (TPR) repeat protein